MNKKEKEKRLRDYSEYMEAGAMEVGRQQNLDVQATIIVKAKQGKMPDSVFVVQAFAQKLAFQENYTIVTYRVLFYFISLSQYENFVSIDIKSIAEDLRISEQSVKRATKQLVENNVIIKVVHPTDKRRLDYFLNPLAMWKGKTINRDKFIDKANKNKMQLDMFTGI
jgi:DNA-binding MarR family transcriptional regulator